MTISVKSILTQFFLFHSDFYMTNWQKVTDIIDSFWYLERNYPILTILKALHCIYLSWSWRLFWAKERKYWSKNVNCSTLSAKIRITEFWKIGAIISNEVFISRWMIPKLVWIYLEWIALLFSFWFDPFWPIVFRPVLM